MNNDIEKLHELLHRLVNEEGGGSWQEKRDRILENSSDDQKTTLAEFVAWFE